MTFSLLERKNLPPLAYNRIAGKAPCVIFLGGFRSDMQGTKAVYLEESCKAAGRAFIRFDYSGHGSSGGEFNEGTIGSWLADSLDIIDNLVEGPLVLAGSSMGGWISLLAARLRYERVKGLIGLAAAPDFTEEIYRENREACDTQFRERGWFGLPNDYSPDPYVITRKLVEEGRRHLLLQKPHRYGIPITLVQGMQDTDVRWPEVLRIRESILDENVEVILIGSADHRLSRPQDLKVIEWHINKICALASGLPHNQKFPGSLSCHLLD